MKNSVSFLLFLLFSLLFVGAIPAQDESANSHTRFDISTDLIADSKLWPTLRVSTPLSEVLTGMMEVTLFPKMTLGTEYIRGTFAVPDYAGGLVTDGSRLGLQVQVGAGGSVGGNPLAVGVNALVGGGYASINTFGKDFSLYWLRSELHATLMITVGDWFVEPGAAVDVLVDLSPGQLKYAQPYSLMGRPVLYLTKRM